MRRQTVVALIALAYIAGTAGAQDITFHQVNRTIPNPVRSVIQGDINRDGYPDLLFGLNASLKIYALKSNGSASYVNSTIPTVYCPSAPLGFGDFKRNGHNDLIVSSSLTGAKPCAPNGPVSSDYLNDGTGAFAQHINITGAMQGIVTSDFNHDMKMDIVSVTGGQVALSYGMGNGSFSAPYKIASLVGAATSLTNGQINLIAGDFDGDGCTDAAWTEYEAFGQRGFQSQLRVAYGNCKGSFTVTTPYNVVGEIDNIKTAEMNRDNVSDIVLTLDAAGQGVTNPTLQISYGSHSRKFTTKLINDPSLSGPIQVVDMNGDGFSDVAYLSASASGAEIKIVEGDVSQSFSRISTHPIPSNYQIIQLLSGDYNRDGKIDLAIAASLAPSGGSVLTQLINTSSYPNGACVAPVTPGIRVCSPGTTSGTTVNVLADATNPNPTVYMSLYVDGARKLAYGSTHELRGSFALTPGTHQFVYSSYDGAGIGNQLVTPVTVH